MTKSLSPKPWNLWWLQLRQCPQSSCCGRASSSCGAGSWAALDGLLPADSSCGPLGSLLQPSSRPQPRCGGRAASWPAQGHGAQALLGEFCLLSPGAHHCVHLSICQLQSLGVLPWVSPCSLVKTDSLHAFLSKGSHSHFRGELCPCALQQVRPLYKEWGAECIVGGVSLLAQHPLCGLECGPFNTQS